MTLTTLRINSLSGAGGQFGPNMGGGGASVKLWKICGNADGDV